IAGYQDNRNYLLFRWQSSQGNIAGPRAELIAMIDGTPRTLASAPRGFAPTQWYRLRMNLGWEKAQVLVDGTLLLEAPNPGAVEGRIGLYANGVLNPKRPKLDDGTATMYVSTDEATGTVTNDAAEAMRGNSVIYFDDVTVGDWTALDDLFTSPYAVERAGTWSVKDRVATTRTGGRLLSGPTDWGQYEATTQVALLEPTGATVYLHMSPEGTGYAWVIGPKGHALHPVVRYARKPPIATAAAALKLGQWTPLRIVGDGPYVALYCNDTLVMDAYDPQRVAGRCGVEMEKNSAAFAPFRVTQLATQFNAVKVHEGFEKNGWMATWSAPESDWYPVVNHGKYIRLPSETNPRALSDPGPSAPLYTDVPGLYWHKGGHYQAFMATLPVSAAALDGQTVHLSANYDATAGYRLQLHKGTDENTGRVTLLRKDATVGSYPFSLTEKTRLVLERRGSYLLLTAQALDPEGEDGDDPIIESEQTLFAYRDAAPLPAEMIGFTVTQPALPAARLTVVSSRVQETFEQAPVGWTVGNGVWLVMNRYTCQPKWNWFGGFGKGLPHVWCNIRLDGDQNVEVFMGVKMQFDNQAEEYNRRFRDMNISICTDGEHVNSGYTVIRGGKVNGRQVTMLLRKNTVVASSTLPEHTLPMNGSGHRQWFATRIEKRGAEIKVFTNNQLAFTYVDPEPLPGGYTAFWTLDNGILLGRVNLSAATMTPGQPHAFTPLAVQQELPPLPVPSLAVDGVTAPLATFETGLDGFRERPEPVIGARLIRERETDPQRGANTYLRAINSYPGGDFSFSLPVTGISLAKRPLLHLDYNFEPDVRVNLYAKVQGTWYEFLLSGKEAQEANVTSAGKAAVVADGRWHHLALDLGTPIIAALRAEGKPPVDLTLQELVFANWETSGDARWYGFGVNPGHRSLCLDNVILLPAVAGPASLSWSGPNAETAAWRAMLDTNP
ncbi:MAG TPA: hypothetical protein PLZ36_12570, partial [Armatimonadota bacterium]|nr:hypothetical protein [Armatimonadota bacterium]